MPLSSTCPMDFACMPEHFVEDAMELLIFASRIPKALDGVILVGYILKLWPESMSFYSPSTLSSVLFVSFVIDRTIS